MSQERWDVVLRFLNGPLSYQTDVVCRGPVVRMGANPPPGGLLLDGYRGLDSIQATITSYNGSQVRINPMGNNQVRVAPHPHVNWSELQTLRNPVYLSPGDTFHLGAPNRGATITFVECRRLGVWERREIISESGQADGAIQPIDIKELDAQGNIPRWFVPAVLAVLMMTMVAIIVPVAVHLGKLGEIILGEQAESLEYIAYVTDAQLNSIEQSDLEGFYQAFDAFVMAPNAEAAERPMLREHQNWDEAFYRRTVASAKLHRNDAFWKRLENIKDDYAYVTEQLRDANLPTVFAAIPYQESQYRASVVSPVCAKGYWQFMPETANRYDLRVRNCSLQNSSERWSPTDVVPPPGIFRNAPYVYYNEAENVARCRITDCEIDERTELEASTTAAIEMLKDSWDHEQTQASGAAVQMSILAHNMGFNDTQYMTSGRKYGVLDAYNAHLQGTNRDRAPHFYGVNITCDPSKEDPHKPNTTTSKCGGRLPNQTQHYGYNIVAQHLLAVCYYAINHGDEPAFAAWEEYTYGEGYCTQLSVPERALFLEDN